jgi:hypothetical protein
VIWIIYLASDSDALAWIAFAILAVVALLGWTMFAIWFQRRQRGAVAQAVDPGTPAEQHFPVSVVALHGLLAVTTVVLVFDRRRRLRTPAAGCSPDTTPAHTSGWGFHPPPSLSACHVAGRSR